MTVSRDGSEGETVLAAAHWTLSGESLRAAIGRLSPCPYSYYDSDGSFLESIGVTETECYNAT